MGKFLGTYMQTCIIKILGNNFQQQLQHPITKKADAEPKKSRSNKKSRCRTSLLKNGPTKLPCLLIILASWVDFFDIGLLLYPVPHHTLQCCTRKSFWVTRTGESKLFCIGFSLFWSRCRTWCNSGEKLGFNQRTKENRHHHCHHYPSLLSITDNHNKLSRPKSAWFDDFKFYFYRLIDSIRISTPGMIWSSICVLAVRPIMQV